MPVAEKIHPKIVNAMPQIGKKRFSLHLERVGNFDSQFCSQRKIVQHPNKDRQRSFNEIMHLVLLLKQSGVEAIEFTGAEPTNRPDLARIVAATHRAGVRHVSVATNGVRLSDRKFLQKLKTAGVNEFRFLLLGHNAAIHEQLTHAPGSFKRILQALQNCQRLHVEARMNIVVTGLNHNYLLPLTEMAVKLQVKYLNFLCLNPDFTTAGNQDSMNFLYSLVAPKFQKIADNFWSEMKKITFTFIPFCFMVGYEQYVTNCSQISYDPEESDLTSETHFRYLFQHSEFSSQTNLSFLSAYKNAFQFDLQKFGHQPMQKFFELKYKQKAESCQNCRYDLICDGLWRNYVKWIGFHEIQPVPGEKISDPTHFMRI